MHSGTTQTATADTLSHAFEHSITWEDDLWRADPVDVETVHAKARRKFRPGMRAPSAPQPVPS